MRLIAAPSHNLCYNNQILKNYTMKIKQDGIKYLKDPVHSTREDLLNQKKYKLMKENDESF